MPGKKGKDRKSERGLEEAVREAIAADPGMRGYGIDVQSRGGEVVLTGVVDVLAEKERLQEIAAHPDLEPRTKRTWLSQRRRKPGVSRRFGAIWNGGGREMSRGRAISLLPVALFLAVPWLLAGCTAAENNWTGAANRGTERCQKVTETVPAGQFKRFTLRTGPGEVLITGSSEDAISVEVEKRASGADAAAVDAYLEGVRLEVKASGENVQVATILPEESPAGVKLVGVRHLIRMPTRVRGTIEVETDRARVHLSGVGGEAKIMVRQADVEVRDFSGNLKVDVQNGQTLVQRLDGQLDIKSTGPVEISDSRLREKGRVETVNARLWVSLAELDVGQYEFLTSNAPVRLALPYGAAARFRVATTNGRVYDELPLTWVDRNETDSDGVYHFEGWLNAGGAQVAVVTTNADVTLAYR
ncbi:MAG: BON domain-containing protein [Bacillota bacterium]|nr:BON domain-containing protein [Bacillota bacterium]